MATKTITIDVDAYDRLKRVQRPTESFSQTIKRVVPRPLDLEAWLSKDLVDLLSRTATSN